MKKILIADDELPTREILSEFFTMLGFEVIEAEDGKVAIDKYQQQSPDAALLDLQMPGMKGDEAAMLILEKNPDFPIIILSGYIDKNIAEELLNRGIYKVLEKPVNLAQIKNIIHDIFKNIS
jgi:CheY-like chemotaxis protein